MPSAGSARNSGRAGDGMAERLADVPRVCGIAHEPAACVKTWHNSRVGVGVP